MGKKMLLGHLGQDTWGSYKKMLLGHLGQDTYSRSYKKMLLGHFGQETYRRCCWARIHSRSYKEMLLGHLGQDTHSRSNQKMLQGMDTYSRSYGKLLMLAKIGYRSTRYYWPILMVCHCKFILVSLSVILYLFHFEIKVR